jgi:hypothetical protein
VGSAERSRTRTPPRLGATQHQQGSGAFAGPQVPSPREVPCQVASPSTRPVRFIAALAAGSPCSRLPVSGARPPVTSRRAPPPASGPLAFPTDRPAGARRALHRDPGALRSLDPVLDQCVGDRVAPPVPCFHVVIPLPRPAETWALLPTPRRSAARRMSPRHRWLRPAPRATGQVRTASRSSSRRSRPQRPPRSRPRRHRGGAGQVVWTPLPPKRSGRSPSRQRHGEDGRFLQMMRHDARMDESGRDRCGGERKPHQQGPVDRTLGRGDGSHR